MYKIEPSIMRLSIFINKGSLSQARSLKVELSTGSSGEPLEKPIQINNKAATVINNSNNLIITKYKEFKRKKVYLLEMRIS